MGNPLSYGTHRFERHRTVRMYLEHNDKRVHRASLIYLKLRVGLGYLLDILKAKIYEGEKLDN